MKDIPIPSYLQSTMSMILSAYPHGIPEQEYLPLLALLYPYLSHRNLAEALSLCDSQRLYPMVYHDILKVVSTEIPTQESIQQVKEKLTQAGFAKWILEE